MKKINISEVSLPLITLEMVNMVRLIDMWQDMLLRGGFWRLYWNSAAGAGVYMNGQKKEFFPDRLYLLPPDCNLDAWCENPNVFQMYIHFEAMQYLGSQRGLCMETELTGALQALLEKITTSFREEGEEWRRNLWGLALVSETLASFPQEMLNEQNADRRFVDVCNFMRLHFNEDLRLEELARQVNMVPNAFLRKFRELYLITPYQYLLHLRYVHAARLLLTRQMTLKEIAASVGIHDSFQFSRGFKAVYGVSPALYCRQQKSLRKQVGSGLNREDLKH